MKTKKDEKTYFNNELKNLLILIAIVIAIFVIFYGLTVLIDSKPKKESNQIVSETIQYTEILAGQILNMNDNNYFVLVVNENNAYNDLYEQFLLNKALNNNKFLYYKVDLNNPLNSNYVSEKTEVKGNDVSKYKFSDTVLLEVKDKKLNKVYKEYDEIEKVLNK